MAELLAIGGGLASFAQIAAYILQTSQAITAFCRDVADAPEELQRLQHKLTALQRVLEDVNLILESGDQKHILPPELQQLVLTTTTLIQDEISSLRNVFGHYRPATLKRKERFRWACLDRQLVVRHLQRLRDMEMTLGLVIDILTLYKH